MKKMALKVPAPLASFCQLTPERRAWLDRLPAALRSLEVRWSLTLGRPFDNASCAWVAPAKRVDGSSAVLKLGMPHMEGEHEIQGLRFWDGEPTVRLLDAEDELGAMLLEHCEPGTPLRLLPEPE
jgi:streptomycin 6-kinase